MKALLLFAFVICLFASTQATYVRVINAVPGTQVLDVYYNVPNSNEKIRFFQDLNSTDVPPYFFMAVPSGNSSVSFTFLFKDTADYFGAPATADQLANQPTYNASIRAGNFTYTLIVASPSQGQSNQSSSLGTYPCPYLESPNSQSNYQFLLLNDRAQGDQPPSGVQFIRLVNLAPQATSISLVTMDAQCPQSNQTTGNQTEGQGQGSQGQQSGNQTQPSVIVNELPFLQSSDYVALPQGTSPQQLAVCYQGDKIPVVDTPMLKQSAKQFSILLFTGTQQNQTGNQTQEQNQTQVVAGQEQNQTQSQTQGSVEGSEQNQTEAQFQVQNQSQSQNQTSENQGQAGTQNQTQSQNQQGSQGSQSQSQQQSQSPRQGGFLATLTDDEPDTTQNVRIRVIHAYPAVSTVTVLLDGRTLASNLEFGNVTQYMMTTRGIHNITVIPSSGSQNDSQSSIAANPIIVFLAWRRTYTVAIVPTGVSVQSNESESSNETMGSGQSGAIGGISQNASEQALPGFRSFYHQILIDELSQNASLGQNLAYIQVVHLAPNVSAVDVSFGNYNISNLQFLQSSHYINVSTSGQTNITISQSGNILANVVSRNLQPRTLYTIWIIGNQMESSESSGASNVRVFGTMDRRVTIRCVLDDEE